MVNCDVRKDKYTTSASKNANHDDGSVTFSSSFLPFDSSAGAVVRGVGCFGGSFVSIPKSVAVLSFFPIRQAPHPTPT